MPASRAYSASSTADGGTYRLALAVLVGGLAAGTLDIFVARAINKVGPGVILQAIVSGLLGRGAFQGGAGAMAIGLGLQWAMSLIISAIYRLASLKLHGLYRRPALFGALYGIPVYIVMTFVVLPLSAAHPKHFPTVQSIVLNLAAMILFGLILAFTGWAIKAARR